VQTYYSSVVSLLLVLVEVQVLVTQSPIATVGYLAQLEENIHAFQIVPKQNHSKGASRHHRVTTRLLQAENDVLRGKARQKVPLLLGVSLE
jgi:hypothetical protein